MRNASAKSPAVRNARPRAPKRAVLAAPDELRPEYDFREARRNAYAARYAAGATAVVLDPDVAAAFPSATAVNDVLRTVAGLIRGHPPAKRARRSA